MGVVATVAAVVGAGATVYGTIQGVKAQKKASRARQRQQQLQARRSRREAIRRQQVARAQAIASAQSAGGLGGSGTAGGIGSLSSRTGSALGYSTQMSGISGIINSAQRDAAQAEGIAGLGSSLFNLGMDFGAFQGNQTPNRPPRTEVNTGSPGVSGIGTGALY